MIDWLCGILDWCGLDWTNLLWGVLLFILLFSFSIAEVIFILVRLPPTYFLKSYVPGARYLVHPANRFLYLLGKNLVGVLHVVVGILLSLPGVPGQGILTILIGIMLLDIPGMRRLERKLVSRPKVLGAINAIRRRFGKPPVVLEEQRSSLQ